MISQISSRIQISAPYWKRNMLSYLERVGKNGNITSKTYTCVKITQKGDSCNPQTHQYDIEMNQLKLRDDHHRGNHHVSCGVKLATLRPYECDLPSLQTVLECCDSRWNWCLQFGPSFLLLCVY